MIVMNDQTGGEIPSSENQSKKLLQILTG